MIALYFVLERIVGRLARRLSVPAHQARVTDPPSPSMGSRRHDLERAREVGSRSALGRRASGTPVAGEAIS